MVSLALIQSRVKVTSAKHSRGSPTGMVRSGAGDDDTTTIVGSKKNGFISIQLRCNNTHNPWTVIMPQKNKAFLSFIYGIMKK